MATLFVDYDNGNDNYGGTSFALLSSATDGRISSDTFSSASANFLNDGTYATKNLLSYAEFLNNNSFFTQARTTIASVNITSPTGITGAEWSVLETADTNTHELRTVGTSYLLTLAQNYTFSCYVKSNGRNQLVLRFGNTAAKGIRYNISTGTLAQSGASASGSITGAGNGWYRITLTCVPDTTTDIIYIILTEDSYADTTSPSYAGDTTKGFYIAAPQLEQASSVTSYETPPSNPQYLSIFNGSTYNTYQILRRISSTSLQIAALIGGTALANQAVDRQYYIGGRWKNVNITNSNVGATAVRLIPGDTIRIMGSPAPTLVGSGLWTSERCGTSIGISSSTNTSPITINTASSMSTLGISTGDTITIAGHTTNTNANGTWVVTVANAALGQCTLNGSTGNGVGGASGNIRKRTNSVVTLTSAVNANIASHGNRGTGRTAWTGATNVTASLDTTDTREGDVSDSIAIAAAFTTGKAAYKATGTLNLSGYQQLSFFIKQTVGTVAIAGDISLRLCTDTTGDVSVHTFNIPAIGLLSTWACFTVDLGTNLNSNIQSVALYVDTDRGAQTFLLSNIIACKASSSADSLNLTSLISTSNSADSMWFPIMSINGTRVVLGATHTYTPLTGPTSNTDIYRGYYSLSGGGTLDVYKRETIKTPVGLTVNTPQIIRPPEAGVVGSPFNFEGGWDRTNMSTQNLETYIDGTNGYGIGLLLQNMVYVNVNKIGVVRYYIGGDFSGYHISNMGLEYAIACTNIGWNFSSACQQNTITKIGAIGNNYGITVANGACTQNFSNVKIYGNIIAGIYSDTSSSNNKFNNINILNTGRAALDLRSTSDMVISSGVIEASTNTACVAYASHGILLRNISTSGNVGGGISLGGGELFLQNCTINESTEFIPTSSSNARIYSTNHDNTSNNYIISTDFGLIRPQTSIRYSNSGWAWSLSPTNATYRNISYPLDFKIATIAVSANSLVTVKAWMRRTNILLAAGLRIKGGQISGVSNDITSYMNAAADTWQQVTLSFTPTEVGVVEILAECYGGSTYTAYVDDLSVTQV
jgi:hypothetical protein